MTESVTEVAMGGTLVRKRVLKRCFDIMGAAISLLVFLPLFLTLYLVLRCEGESVIFKQERIGYKGKPFMLYKFRSMVVEAETNGPQLASGVTDRRLTKVGRFLRAHHLDELPQLWNILKGDMSFVGYRPERRFFIEQIMAIDPNYALLYELRPGVTSMATLDNGYTDSMEKMVKRLEMDLEYMRNCSLRLDLKILITTFWRIVRGIKF